MINEFIEQRENEEQELILQFATAILDCELRKKEATEDIKEIKKDAKANGVLVKKVMEAFTQIKKQLKTDDFEKSQTEEMVELLISNPDVMYKLESLVAKD